MLSDQIIQYADSLYPPIPGLPRDEDALMRLLLGTLPASDPVSVSNAVLLDFVRHGLFLRARSPYCREVPEDIFLHHVLYPRVNSEDLVAHRTFFYQMLAPLVEGKAPVEAALAINRWCAAQMTYTSTDERTINPLTAYFCGLGRCGEESTFAVAAFRSVGIPARQVYAPWWSHCDDNHAWVEVYLEGSWRFLGACEPEPILDRGWFTSAATRAMVAVSRTFFGYTADGLSGEQLIRKEGSCLHYNQISRYAKTCRLTLTVENEDGIPVPGALVLFSVVNMASFSPVEELITNEKGQVSLEAGLGSLLVEARFENKYAFLPIRTDLETLYTLTLRHGPEAAQFDFEFLAPSPGDQNRTALSPAQQAEKTAVLTRAKELRKERIQSYFLPVYETANPELRLMLHQAGGNAPQLWDFFTGCTPEEQPLAMALLRTLAPKDYRDVSSAVLRSHLDGCNELHTFDPYVISPRIGYEMLTPWRQEIPIILPPSLLDAFRADPMKILPWVRVHFQPGGGRFYSALWLAPADVLRLGAGDIRGQRLLTVAIARTLGIPARLNPMDGKAQIMLYGAFVTAEDSSPMGTLEIDPRDNMTYFQNWTISRWEDGWQTLDLTKESGNLLSLPQGRYRAITANRMPNGNQLVSCRVFALLDHLSISLALTQAAPGQMLSAYPVPLTVPGLELRIHLEPGTEPTVHVLNELLEAQDVREIMDKGLSIRLLVPSSQPDPTLSKVQHVLPGVVLEEADFTSPQLEALARAMYLEPGVCPLLVLSGGNVGYYGHCGYGVNSVPLALKLAKYLLSN